MTDYTIETDYLRVIPRDLFNEAKLLKCIGRLVLTIHDGDSMGLSFEDYGGAFEIGRDNDGYLQVLNINFMLNGYSMIFRCKPYSKDNYTLYCSTTDYNDYLVFDDNGNYTEEFKTLCNTLKK